LYHRFIYIGMSVDDFEGRVPDGKDKGRRETFAKIVHEWTEDNARVADLTHEEEAKGVAAITRVSLDPVQEVTDLRGSSYISSAL
jgi:formylmethanofuran dehydrogenase subunit A